MTIAIRAANLQPADSFAGIIPSILEARLAEHNIFAPIDWLRMSPRQRGKLFGITRAHVELINHAMGVRS